MNSPNKQRTAADLVGAVINLGAEFWALHRRKSGLLVDVLRAQNTPANAKSIDRIARARWGGESQVHRSSLQVLPLAEVFKHLDALWLTEPRISELAARP